MPEVSPQAPSPHLGIAELLMFMRGSSSPAYFNKKVRPMLYRKCGNDPEDVHDFVLQISHKYGRLYSRIAGYTNLHNPHKNLLVNINGAKVLPFGTAAGMDKDLEALHALGNVFGFQVPGTVVIRPRPGNPRVRLATIEDNKDLVNAQGFPSKGLEYALNNITSYRNNGGRGTVYASICGLPGEGEDAISASITEVETLASKLGPYVNGFVWNPYSPNTAALAKLRTREVFHDTARAIRKHAGNCLLLVKMGPYEPEDKEKSLALVSGFLEGGGNGVATTNTKMIPKEQLPANIRDVWGYASAGRSGRFLSEYRIRSVKDIRRRFPDAVIAATGGIYSADEAFKAFCAGANLVKGFTPYAYFGTGLAKELMKGVSAELAKTGTDMESLQAHIRQLARDGDTKELDKMLQGSGPAMVRERNKTN